MNRALSCLLLAAAAASGAEPDLRLEVRPDERVRDIAMLKKGIFSWKCEGVPEAFWAQWDRDIGLEGTLVRISFHPQWGVKAADLVPVLRRLRGAGAVPVVLIWGVPLELAGSRDRTLAGNDPGWPRYSAVPPRDEGAWKKFVGDAIRLWNGAGKLGIRYVEIGNEPNGADFWAGTEEQYLEMYRMTAEGIRAADPEVRIGGPSTSNWLGAIGGERPDPATGRPDPERSVLRKLIRYCARTKTPLDFLSWHFAGPGRAEAAQKPVETARGWLREAGLDPTKPIIVDEWAIALPGAESPDVDCDNHVGAAYAAAFFVALAAQGADGQCVTTIMDQLESDARDPISDLRGRFYGIATSHGVVKPIYNVFRLQARLGDEQVALRVEGGSADSPVFALATRRGKAVSVLLSHYAHPFKGSSAGEELLDLASGAGMGVRDLERISGRLKERGAERRAQEFIEKGIGRAEDLPLEPEDRARVAKFGEAWRARTKAASRAWTVRVRAPAEGRFKVTQWRVDATHANAFAVRDRVREEIGRVRGAEIEEACRRLEKKGLDGKRVRELFAAAADARKVEKLAAGFSVEERRKIEAESGGLLERIWTSVGAGINAWPEIAPSSEETAAVARGGFVELDLSLDPDSVRLVEFEPAGK